MYNLVTLACQRLIFDNTKSYHAKVFFYLTMWSKQKTRYFFNNYIIEYKANIPTVM